MTPHTYRKRCENNVDEPNVAETGINLSPIPYCRSRRGPNGLGSETKAVQYYSVQLTVYSKWRITQCCAQDNIVYRPGYFTVHLPAPSGPKFSNSENCCGSKNAMPPKIFWDMEGHRGNFRSKNVFSFKKHILEKNHNKSHYFFNF